MPGPAGVLRRRRYPLVLLLVLAAAAARLDAEDSRAALRAYIKEGWRTLSRSNADLLRAVPDPKVPPPADGRWPVYLSRRESRARVRSALAASLGEEGLTRLDLRVLPARGTPHPPGLLYLPRPYVVPGGRFNEMYGWDSYFIMLGLLADGEVERARDLVDDFVYEVEHYGTVLNANRTYYLTRSQPPFLGRMVLDVYERTRDRAWLGRTRAALERYHRYFTSGSHVVKALGLSRYHDSGRGPAPEVVSSERDASSRTHYDRVRESFRSRPAGDPEVAWSYDRAHDRLTEAFYEGDRAMRESGFDPTDRFGPFGARTAAHAPVCLNALLYRLEEDLAEVEVVLDRPARAARWKRSAAARRRAADRWLWDEAAGLYFDYDFLARRRSRYAFATTFYPLWAGMASPEQARRVAANLPRFLAPGGLRTSLTTSGSQWDAPFGWAPLQVMAVDGLRRYGFEGEAQEIARRFLATVEKEFEEHGTVVEKYDVERRESDLAGGLRFGYTSNEIGFGWTNAAVVHFLSRTGNTAP